MRISGGFRILLISVLSFILLISCSRLERGKFELSQDPKERFLLNILDLGNLLEQNQIVLIGALGEGKSVESPRRMAAGIEPGQHKTWHDISKGP